MSCLSGSQLVLFAFTTNFGLWSLSFGNCSSRSSTSTYLSGDNFTVLTCFWKRPLRSWRNFGMPRLPSCAAAYSSLVSADFLKVPDILQGCGAFVICLRHRNPAQLSQNSRHFFLTHHIYSASSTIPKRD